MTITIFTVEITIMTRKQRVKQIIRDKGKLHAVNKVRELYGWDTRKSYEYVKRLG